MKKILLTEAERKAIIAEREKAIIESFRNTFNKIKRIDENMLAEESDTYFETLSQALDAVREKANQMGYDVDEEAMFAQFGTGGIAYETDKSANIPLFKDGEPILDKRGREANRFIRVSIYRMPSGRYELTMYKTW